MFKSTKKYRRRKNLLVEPQSKDKKTYIDDLFLRIFLSSLLLLCLCAIERFIPNYNLRINLNYNFNLIKATKLFANTPLEIITEDEVITVYETDVYDKVSYDNGINYVTNNNYAGVDNLISGYVVKILKDKDNNGNIIYTVVVKGADGLEYTYLELESIDVSLYRYLDAKETIGKAKYDDDAYHFKLIIENKGEKISFYDN